MARARGFLKDVLDRSEEHPLVDVASLLVSELVTNAVLHAASAVELTVRCQQGRVRVEVADASPATPQRRTYKEEATTGRGLEMVELLAEQWGVDTSAGGGKAVWFEVSGAGSHDPEGEPAAAVPNEASLEKASPNRPVATAPGRGSTEAHLPQAPVRLMATVQQHTETLLRELALVSVEEIEEWAPVRLGIDFDELDHQLRAAMRAGHTAVDLVVHVHDPASELRKAEETLREGDRMAGAGLLLCPPALPEVAGCRGWFLQQLIDQLEGRPAEPWRSQHAAMPERELEIDHAAALDHLAHAVVLADDQNRITYLNGAGQTLLGWASDELVGQRLTAIIPERLHHAHVAGYTRYLLTGRARLLNTPVRVPARHRDGSEIDVELALSAFRSGTGRHNFAAVLRRREAEHAGSSDDADAGEEAASLLLTRTRAVAADTAGLPVDERRRRVLATLATELDWHFGAWWEVGGEHLRCAATWQRSSELDPFVAASAEQRFSVGTGLPGRVWARQAPAWIADLVADANFPRVAVALATGLRSGCAFPIVEDGRVVGVIELCTTVVCEPDEELMDSLAAIGELLGHQG